MQYLTVWLPGVRDIYTWHGDAPVGARVQVAFRGRPRLGVVTSEVDAPLFETQPLLEVLEESFFPASSLALAESIAAECMCPLGKVLGAMIPRPLLTGKGAVKRDVTYSIHTNAKVELLRGARQKAVLNLFEGGARPSLSAGELSEVASTTVLKNMVEKGLLERSEGKVKMPVLSTTILPSFPLNTAQKGAFDAIIDDNRPSYLWGVTGSGKTEIYKKLILQALTNESSQVLFLLPEIGLTPRFMSEMATLAPGAVGVWHSQMTPQQKAQTYMALQEGTCRVLVGARSAALVPLPQLRQIIMDEAHEWTYKSDQSPRFHTRDVVLHLHEKMKCGLVFGSATPSSEAYMQMQKKTWTTVRLTERVLQQTLPEVKFIDMRQERKRGNKTLFSSELVALIQDTIARGKQVLLLLNKRGLFQQLLCGACGVVRECPDCDTPLRLHHRAGRGAEVCHLCGYLCPFEDKCHDCKAPNLLTKGWGTQTTERELAMAFPKAKILRLDADTTGSKTTFATVTEAFAKGDGDILLGTQMIAKGLDFPDVEAVGVLLADTGLGIPDFRAEERVFSLLTQVAGRAGRRSNQGRVLVQTFQPHHPLFPFVKKHDVDGFLAYMNDQRKLLVQPPYAAYYKWTAVDIDRSASYKLAQEWYKYCKAHSSFEAFFAPAMTPKMHGKYHFHVLLKATDKASLRTWLQGHLGALPTGLRFDPTPQSLL